MRQTNPLLALPGFAPSRWLRHTLRLAQFTAIALVAAAATVSAQTPGKKPNILVIFGDDIGQTNISAYSFGVMGYRTPNIDRIAKEGMMFTDYYAEQSCTAGRSSFITSQCTLRTGLSKVGIPAATVGLHRNADDGTEPRVFGDDDGPHAHGAARGGLPGVTE